MNWISNYVRPRINSLFSRRDVPENLWTKCSECGTMLFHRELSQNINVCPNCDHHMNISPSERLINLFDDGVFFIAEIPKPISDPLGFKDQKKYPERMKVAQKKTDSEEAMLVAEGDIGRTKIVAAVQDFSFMGGSMGMYVGNAIIVACKLAV